MSRRATPLLVDDMGDHQKDLPHLKSKLSLIRTGAVQLLIPRFRNSGNVEVWPDRIRERQIVSV